MDRRISRSFIELFIVIIISKVLAFVLTIVFAYFYGSNEITDAYYAAALIPDIINGSLIICILELFIPHYIKIKNRDGEGEAKGFATNVFNCSIVFNCLLFLLVCASAPIFARIVAPGYDGEMITQTVRFIRLLSLSFPFTAGTYVISKQLNSNHFFILPHTLTLVNHIIVLSGVFCLFAYGLYAYPLICTGAWGVQLVLLLVISKKRGVFDFSGYTDFRDTRIRHMVVEAIPLMAATAVGQIGNAIDKIVGSNLPTGSVSCLGYAQLIYFAAYSVTAETVITVFYPTTSRLYSQGETDMMKTSIKRSIDLSVMSSLIICGMLIGNSIGIIRIMFDRGEMKEADLGCIALLLLIYSFGIPAYVIKDLVSHLFYIKGQVKIPSGISALFVVLNIILSIIGMHIAGVYGIAIATTFAVVFCTILGGVALLLTSRSAEKRWMRDVINYNVYFQGLVAVFVGIVAMRICHYIVGDNSSLLAVIISSIVYLLINVAVLFLTKNEYIIWLYEFAVHKIKRGGENG